MCTVHMRRANSSVASARVWLNENAPSIRSNQTRHHHHRCPRARPKVVKTKVSLNACARERSVIINLLYSASPAPEIVCESARLFAASVSCCVCDSVGNYTSGTCVCCRRAFCECVQASSVNAQIACVCCGVWSCAPPSSSSSSSHVFAVCVMLMCWVQFGIRIRDVCAQHLREYITHRVVAWVVPNTAQRWKQRVSVCVFVHLTVCATNRVCLCVCVLLWVYTLETHHPLL